MVGRKALGTKLATGVKAVTNEPEFDVEYCIVAWIEKNSKWEGSVRISSPHDRRTLIYPVTAVARRTFLLLTGVLAPAGPHWSHNLLDRVLYPRL